LNIEHKKRDRPHAYILFWTDSGNQDIHAVEAEINVEHLKDSPFAEPEGMISGFKNGLTPVRYINIPKDVNYLTGNIDLGMLRNLQNRQESGATTTSLLVILKKQALCLAIH
jgi:hypothetical protein